MLNHAPIGEIPPPRASRMLVRRVRSRHSNISLRSTPDSRYPLSVQAISSNFSRSTLRCLRSPRELPPKTTNDTGNTSPPTLSPPFRI